MVASWFLSHQWLAADEEGTDLKMSELLGYLAMILAFTMVFLGVKNYRDQQLNGYITFGQAFLTGMYMVLVTSVIYVVGWMLYYPAFMADFPDTYLQSQLAELESSGLSGEDLAAKKNDIIAWMEWYKKPQNMAGMTFMEIFPVGLVVALISALIWKKKA